MVCSRHGVFGREEPAGSPWDVSEESRWSAYSASGWKEAEPASGTPDARAGEPSGDWQRSTLVRWCSAQARRTGGRSAVSGDPEAAAAGPVDPATVRTLAEFAGALQWLRGSRSYATLDKAVNSNRTRNGRLVLPPATLNNLLHGKSMPRRETVETFLTACGLETTAVRQPWLAAWERVGTGHLRRPAGTVRVRQARPRLLGVHASIQVDPTATELPTYVTRDIDPGLRATITAAAEHGGFVLLVGGSSVGKTRALFEAVQAVMPEWWLVHPDPADAEPLRALAEGSTPRTVVWLDELQRYLNHGLQAAAVRDLVAARIVVVATLWPNEYTGRTAVPALGQPDPHSNDRQLLGLAHVIDVADAFSDTERRRAEALASDDLVRVALDTPDAGFTQILAAGPDLVRWWEQAPDPYGKAIITAMLDARRLGALSTFSGEFLMAAASDYLTPSEQANAPVGWFEQALGYATRKLKGAASALTATSCGRGVGVIAGYLAADYLVQHANNVRRFARVPASAWHALVVHVDDPDDAERVGRAAYARMRYGIAVPLLRRSFAANRIGFIDDFVDSLHKTGEEKEASAVLAAFAIRFRNGLWSKGLQGWLAGGADVEELSSLYSEEEWDEADLRAALRGLADENDEYMQELRNRVGQGDGIAAEELACVLRHRGDLPGLRTRFEAGDGAAGSELVRLLEKRGDVAAAVAVLWQKLEGGWNVVNDLIRLTENRALARRIRNYGLNADGTVASGPSS
jgi:hypothetical protein